MKQILGLLMGTAIAPLVAASALEQPVNTWVKRSPLPDMPPSPRLGYEGACAWDSKHQVLIRYGGHNQGGGGEQNAEVWTFDLRTGRWTLKEPNTSPPGICCGQQNLFDPVGGRYVRFPAFSGSHGWQWRREIYLNDASVWTYDLEQNTWRNLRPLPAARPAPLRCASWDSDHQVVVLFGGEGSSEGTVVYDPYDNTWTWMKPSRQPAFRSGGNMTYDAARQWHILFGAQFSDDPHTWGYDLRRNEWRDLRPPALPPTDKNDAVLTYDPVARTVVALVKITAGKEEAAQHRLETWTFDTGSNRWTKMEPAREPDPSGSRARVLMYAPELNVAVLENRVHSKDFNEQQIWTYRPAEPPSAHPAPPSAPLEVRVVTTASGATVSWKPGGDNPPARYGIHRGTGPKPWTLEWQRVAEVPGAQSSFKDTGLEPGTLYHYAVRAIGADGRESALSLKVRTQPRTVEDVVVSVLSPREIVLRWPAGAAPDLTGYHVERAPVEVYSEDQLTRLKRNTEPLATPAAGAIRRVGAFVRLTARPVPTPFYRDTEVDLSQPKPVSDEAVFERRFSAEELDEAGRPYGLAVQAYRVRAINALGVESGPSAAILTLPSAPQWFFAREEGTTCHLKWAANPEQGLRGYRVYRLNGRWDKDPIPRLTDAPVQALTWSDVEAGKSTRRYHVVAVDALGQEGFPSAPVWFNREWKRFYEPFVTEWHQ